MDFVRMKQVLKYGWKHAGVVAQETDDNGKKHGGRIVVFGDILFCYSKYKMWSNQYLKEKFWSLPKAQRQELGERCRLDGIKRDEWQKDFRENQKFFVKYGNARYELAKLRSKRNEAYTKQYHMGKNCFVGHNVEICRQHYLPGTIRTGDNVSLAKNVFIDYSGEVVIGNDVGIADGAYILTHDHKHQHEAKTKKEFVKDDVAGYLEICDGAIIGARAVIMPTCHRIGKFARIGTGTIVAKDVPDYAVVMSPAAIILNPKALKGRQKENE